MRKLFSYSLHQTTVPVCFKAATVIPEEAQIESAERHSLRDSDVSRDADVGETGPYASEVSHQLQYGSTTVRLHGQPMH